MTASGTWDIVGSRKRGNMTDDADQLKRIADILEEILKLVKKDMGAK